MATTSSPTNSETTNRAQTFGLGALRQVVDTSHGEKEVTNTVDAPEEPAEEAQEALKVE